MQNVLSTIIDAFGEKQTLTPWRIMSGAWLGYKSLQKLMMRVK